MFVIFLLTETFGEVFVFQFEEHSFEQPPTISIIGKNIMKITPASLWKRFKETPTNMAYIWGGEELSLPRL